MRLCGNNLSSCKCAPGVSVSTTPLIVEQANVMHVFEFREVPEPMIFMEYYLDGNMADALMVKLRSFQVIITDFGLSKVVPNVARLRASCGTLQYAVPEVFPVQSRLFVLRCY